MRIRTLLFTIALALQFSALAQDARYPTLEALDTLEVPAFSYVDMVGRMTGKDTSYAPPANPPQYEVGDRETFRLQMGEDYDFESVEMELRGLTDRVLIWVQDDVDYPRWRARNIAQRIETQVMDPMQRLFQYEEPPGIDGDPRLYVALMLDSSEGALAYFHKSSTLPKRLYKDSNQREMLVVNLYWDEDYDYFDHWLFEIVAHEYIHILHHHSDFGEEKWLDEGLANYAGYRASSSRLQGGNAQQTADAFLEAPHTGLTQWFAVEEKGPKYGAAFLFVLYLAEQFGVGIVPALLKEKANGWTSVDKVLRQYTEISVDEVFADWVLANYFQDFRRGYGYKSLDAELSAPAPAASYNSFPTQHEGDLHQYSTEYISVDVRGADKLHLRLLQDAEAKLMELDAADGEQVYYAVPTDKGHNRLTRRFDLSGISDAQLQYSIWYDLDYDGEQAYVTLSEDNGETWRSLRGRKTTSPIIYRAYYHYGYMGRARIWRPEQIDLSRFAPGNILLRFELMSDFVTNYRGLAIDDLRIEAIGFHDSFETHDDGWVAEGWIRSDNRLPNNTWLQVVQDTRDRLHISRTLINGSGDLTVELQPGVSQVLVAVSPVVPYTSLETEYQLELTLMNAAGEFMVVSRECTVTTTHALNFRDAPNGAKIGLLPQGATVDALDRKGDWFMVDYYGRQGWVHGDYVIKAGNCP